MVFTHTEVDPDAGQSGLGSTLVRAALDDVRSQGGSVVPQCPFVRGWIERHQDYADLVAEHRRLTGVARRGHRARATPLEHVLAVHLAERVGDELDAGAVGVAEVDRDAAVHLVRHAGLVEPLAPAPAQRSGSTLIAMWCSPPSTSAYGPTSRPGKSKNASRLPLPMSKKKCEEPG